MARDSSVLEVERPAPVDGTMTDLQPDTNDRASAGVPALASPVVKKFNLTRPSSISATPPLSRRSTALSATERCGSASTSRPERN